jgi:hypothetical protein
MREPHRRDGAETLGWQVTDHVENRRRPRIVVRCDQHEIAPRRGQRPIKVAGLCAHRVRLGCHGVKQADSILCKRDIVALAHRVDGHARIFRVEIQLGRADHMDRAVRFAQGFDPPRRLFGRHEMVACQLGIAVPEHLVDGSRHLAAFDVGGTDVVRCGDQSAGQRLDPVAMYDDQIGTMFGDEIGKSHDGFGQNHILRIAGPLIQEFMHRDARHPVHLDLGQAVSVQQVHARHKERHGEPGVAGGHGQRFKFAEIGAGAGNEKNGSGHVPAVMMRADLIGGPQAGQSAWTSGRGMPKQTKRGWTRMTQDRVVICMKWGALYAPDYVNVLYNACRVQITGPFRFVCLTENTEGLRP